jgi:hypothetical protein
MDKKEREREFTAYLSETFPSSTRGTSGVFHKDFGEKIIGALKDLSSVDKNLRFFVRKHKFKILNLPSLGAHDVLVVPTKHQVCHSPARFAYTITNLLCNIGIGRQYSSWGE